MRSSESPLRSLEPVEIGVAAAMLARAFDADPLFVFLTPGARQRARWLAWFHRVALGEAIRVGRVWVAASPERGAIAVFPPSTYPAPLTATLGALPFPPGIPSRRLLVEGIGAELETRREHPPFRHVYVRVLGVAPEHEGEGLGGALMAQALAFASELGVRTYLETSNPVNLPFYRRFGFDVLGELTSYGGPPIWRLATPT